MDNLSRFWCTDDEKEEVARSWLVDKPGYDVIVATTAFGMGIDKPNVRLRTRHPIAMPYAIETVHFMRQ